MPHRIQAGQPLPLMNIESTRALEHQAAARLAPGTLMARAGLAIARLALALAPHARQFWIVCGPGNNGGDGLQAAMHLRQWGKNPVVTWLGTDARAPIDARGALHRARRAQVTFADHAPVDLGPADLCIDALLGIGASRAPTGRMAELLQQLRAAPAPLLCVDVPSGLNADTGVLLEPQPETPRPANVNRSFRTRSSACPMPCHTLTLLTCKPGLFTMQGRDACGTLWFDDLSVDPPPDDRPAAWLNAPLATTARPHASHKGSFGDVAVVGGTSDQTHGAAMQGAALLAASAALHGGAGRVFVSLLGDRPAMLDAWRPELMFRRPDTLALDQITTVCGCGGGTRVARIVAEILPRTPRLVLDADALNAVALDRALQQTLRSRAGRDQCTILTPHPLEAARLLGMATGQVQSDRLGAAQTLADDLRCVVVLKGSGTVIAAPAQVPRINPTGNARLATPGTGDVLAGFVGALLARGHDAFAAACDAVWRHGAVADAWPGHATLTAAALARHLTWEARA